MGNKYKLFDKDTLYAANGRAIRKRYARTLDPDALLELPDDGAWPVRLAMPTPEGDIRCEIDLEGKTVFLDIDPAVYETLAVGPG